MEVGRSLSVQKNNVMIKSWWFRLQIPNILETDYLVCRFWRTG